MTTLEYKEHLEKLLRGLEDDDYSAREADLLRLQFEILKELYELDSEISNRERWKTALI